jgi:hypothetical protein
MKTILLDKTKHDRNQFDCELADLNYYFKAMASQQAKKTTLEHLFLKITATTLR